MSALDDEFSSTYFRGPAQWDIRDYLNDAALKDVHTVTPADCAVAIPTHLHLAAALDDGGVYIVKRNGLLEVPLAEHDRSRVLRQKRVILSRCRKYASSEVQALQLMRQVYLKLKPKRQLQREVANLNRQNCQLRRQMREITKHWTPSEDQSKQLELLQARLDRNLEVRQVLSNHNPQHKRMHTIAIQEVLLENNIPLDSETVADDDDDDAETEPEHTSIIEEEEETEDSSWRSRVWNTH